MRLLDLNACDFRYLPIATAFKLLLVCAGRTRDGLGRSLKSRYIKLQKHDPATTIVHVELSHWPITKCPRKARLFHKRRGKIFPLLEFPVSA